MSDYSELKILAKAATLGPWHAEKSENGQPCIYGPGIELIGCEGFVNAPEQDWSIANFIAAANPAVVLALIESVNFWEGMTDKALGLANEERQRNEALINQLKYSGVYR